MMDSCNELDNRPVVKELQALKSRVTYLTFIHLLTMIMFFGCIIFTIEKDGGKFVSQHVDSLKVAIQPIEKDIDIIKAAVNDISYFALYGVEAFSSKVNYIKNDVSNITTFFGFIENCLEHVGICKPMQ